MSGRPRGPLLALALAGTFLLVSIGSYACGNTSGGSGSTGAEAGTSAGDDGATASDGGSSNGSSSGPSSTSSGGVPSGGSGSSGGRIVYTCTGCIDLEGQCNDGGADDKCGITGGGCANCAAFHQVCGAGGECVNASGDAGPGAAANQDSGTD